MWLWKCNEENIFGFKNQLAGICLSVESIYIWGSCASTQPDHSIHQFKYVRMCKQLRNMMILFFYQFYVIKTLIVMICYCFGCLSRKWCCFGREEKKNAQKHCYALNKFNQKQGTKPQSFQKRLETKRKTIEMTQLLYWQWFEMTMTGNRQWFNTIPKTDTLTKSDKSKKLLPSIELSVCRLLSILLLAKRQANCHEDTALCAGVSVRAYTVAQLYWKPCQCQ